MTTTRLFPRPARSSLFSSFAALTLLGLASLGCGSTKHTPDGGDAGGATDGGADTTTACVASGSGTLVVAVTGLPADATMPMVRVSGGGLATPMMLAVGTPATVPAQGGYTIEYRRVKVAPAAGGIVGKAYYVSATSFDGCVQGGGATTTATLTYTQEPGSEHLWISVSDAPTLGNELASFASADLAATAAKNPSLWKTQNFTGRPSASAFDSSGNLWVAGGDVINMYPMMSLATAGAAPPTVVLTQPTTAAAKSLAFDADGNLWVTRGNPGTDHSIVRYSLADQAASGTPTPGVVVTNAALVNPAGLAFDGNGDLWVASEGTGKVLRYNSEHIAASYTGAPDVILGAGTPVGAPVASAYDHPNGVAFDEAGLLWVGFLDQLVGFTKTQQMATADLAGPLTVNAATGSGGFVFDQSGGLWFADAMSKFQRIPKAQLTAGGDVTPDIVITSSDLGYAEGFVLDPSPTWSFLQDWL